MPAGKKSVTQTVTINRAPVLTLWAAIVAQRLGYEWNAALTLGHAVAGLNARSKARTLGIVKAKGKPSVESEEKKPAHAGLFPAELLGRIVPAVKTPEGVRAIERGKPIDPASVQRYLEQKYGDHLGDARDAMRKLAASYPPDELAERAFSLYETFRPETPRGKKGWGAAGVLDLELIRSMAE